MVNFSSYACMRDETVDDTQTKRRRKTDLYGVELAVTVISLVCAWLGHRGSTVHVFTSALNHSPFNISADGPAAINPASATRLLRTVL